jgi:hypothetical protein
MVLDTLKQLPEDIAKVMTKEISQERLLQMSMEEFMNLAKDIHQQAIIDTLRQLPEAIVQIINREMPKDKILQMSRDELISVAYKIHLQLVTNLLQGLPEPILQQMLQHKPQEKLLELPLVYLQDWAQYINQQIQQPIQQQIPEPIIMPVFHPIPDVLHPVPEPEHRQIAKNTLDEIPEPVHQELLQRVQLDVLLEMPQDVIQDLAKELQEEMNHQEIMNQSMPQQVPKPVPQSASEPEYRKVARKTIEALPEPVHQELLQRIKPDVLLEIPRDAIQDLARKIQENMPRKGLLAIESTHHEIINTMHRNLPSRVQEEIRRRLPQGQAYLMSIEEFSKFSESVANQFRKQEINQESNPISESVHSSTEQQPAETGPKSNNNDKRFFFYPPPSSTAPRYTEESKGTPKCSPEKQDKRNRSNEVPIHGHIGHPTNSFTPARDTFYPPTESFVSHTPLTQEEVKIPTNEVRPIYGEPMRTTPPDGINPLEPREDVKIIDKRPNPFLEFSKSYAETRRRNETSNRTETVKTTFAFPSPSTDLNAQSAQQPNESQTNNPSLFTVYVGNESKLQSNTSSQPEFPKPTEKSASFIFIFPSNRNNDKPESEKVETTAIPKPKPDSPSGFKFKSPTIKLTDFLPSEKPVPSHAASKSNSNNDNSKQEHVNSFTEPSTLPPNPTVKSSVDGSNKFCIVPPDNLLADPPPIASDNPNSNPPIKKTLWNESIPDWLKVPPKKKEEPDDLFTLKPRQRQSGKCYPRRK